MKPVFARRSRRRSKKSSSEGAFFKKEGQETFFGVTGHDVFFNPAVATTTGQPVQRKCAECEEEQKAQRQPDKKEEEKVQRQPDKKEEEKVQRQPEKKEEDKVVQKKENAGSSSPAQGVSNYVSSLNGKGESLSAESTDFFNSRMGYDFSNVKIHTGKEAAESAKSINAKAYTVGNNIVFNEGQYNVESATGKKLLAHELTHVIQQQEGAISRDKLPNADDPTTRLDVAAAGGAQRYKRKKGPDEIKCKKLHEDAKKLSQLLSWVRYHIEHPFDCPYDPFWVCKETVIDEFIKHADAMAKNLGEGAGRYDWCCSYELKKFESLFFDLFNLWYRKYEWWNPDFMKQFINLRVAIYEAIEAADKDYKHC